MLIQFATNRRKDDDEEEEYEAVSYTHLDVYKRQTVTRPCTVYKTGDKSFSIILTQGLNRQIRRMCEYLGYHVCTLKRIRIMNLTLDGLKCGEYREICGDEWKKLNELIRDSSSETVIRTCLLYTSRIGGGFGAKQTSVSEIYPAIVTWKTGRPSKMIFSRYESMICSSPRHEKMCIRDRY